MLPLTTLCKCSHHNCTSLEASTVVQKEFYEKQNAMLTHAAAARSTKKARRRATLDHRSLAAAKSPASPMTSGMSLEGGSQMHGPLSTLMEALEEDDEVTGLTVGSGESDGVAPAPVKKPRHGTGHLATYPATLAPRCSILLRCPEASLPCSGYIGCCCTQIVTLCLVR